MKKVVIVTGASSGIGREFVRQIERKQKFDEIWVIARREDRLEELKTEIATPLKIFALDLSVGESFDLLKSALEKEKPSVRLLINCAGFGKFGHFEKIPLEAHLNMVDLNCKAVVSACTTALPYMSEGAKIINVASCAAFQPIPYVNVYAATKAFVLSFSRASNVELKYRKIGVTAVCPYWVKTEFFDRAINTQEKPVIVNYGVMYKAEDVVKKAIRDAYKGKDLSAYGTVNRLQKFGAKILPHKLVMKIWMRRQKFDGTPDVR